MGHPGGFFAEPSHPEDQNEEVAPGGVSGWRRERHARSDHREVLQWEQPTERMVPGLRKDGVISARADAQRALIHHAAAPWELVGRLALQVAELQSRVDRIEGRHQADAHIDPIETWIRNNKTVLERYAGQNVAIHPVEGVVASGPDYASVADQVREKGLEKDVVVRFIRRG